MRRRIAGGLGALLLATLPALAAAQGRDCEGLPTSAKRPRPCNPQEECLRQIPKELTGQARDAAARDCRRQPTSGICYGPDTYNPQAECREKRK